MPSPFPGMDPYLEDPEIWSDFHTTVLVAIRAALKPMLPRGYLARIDRYVWLHEPDANTRRRLGKPDVFTIERNEVPSAGVTSMLVAPSEGAMPVIRRQGQRYLRIVDRLNRRLVTVLELLSPTNKASGEDRDNYLAKRDEYLATGTNLVEIDLHRAGKRMPMGTPPPPEADYYIVVCRAEDFPQSKRWPFGLRDPFPPVPVPLGPGEPVISVDFKACMERAYNEASLDEDIDYFQQPHPALSKADAAWARKLLRRWKPGKGANP